MIPADLVGLRRRVPGGGLALRHLRTGLIAIVVVVNLFVCGLLAYALNASKAQHEKEVRNYVENFAALLDYSISGSVGKIDLSLREIIFMLERDLRQQGFLNADEVNAILRQRRDWLAGLAEFRVTDASGHVRYGPGVMPGDNVSYADRSFFETHRRNGDAGLIVPNPVLGKVTKVWIIPFTRRYNYPDGSFAGMISASVPVEYFTRLLSGVDLGPQGIALLRDADTGLITRYPASFQQVGSKGFSPELQDIIASGVSAQAFHAKQTGDGIERTNAYRRLAAVPFHLVVGKAADDYLAHWRSEIVKAAILAVIFVLASVGSGWLLWRAFRLAGKASEQSRLLLRHASDGVHIVDIDGNVIEASDSFCRMLGYSRDEVIGMNVRQWDAKFQPAELTELIRLQTELRDVATFETLHRRKDGQVVEVEVSSYALELDGALVLYNSARDVSVRMDMERRLRQSRDRFETFAQASSDWFWELDRDLRFTWLSDRCPAITGGGRRSMIGLHPWDLPMQMAEDDSRQNAADLRAHRPFRDLDCSADTPDGRCDLRISGMPMFDEAGSFVGYLGTGRDVTALKRTETELRESRLAAESAHRAARFAREIARTKQLLSEAHRIARLGVVEFDVHTGTWQLGERMHEMLGIADGRLSGISDEIFVNVDPDDRRRLLGYVAALGVHGLDMELRVEDRILHALGEAVGDGPEHEATVVTFQDITQRRLSEQERAAMIERMAEANRLEALGTLAGGIAHEINSPIQFVNDNLTFMKTSFTDLLGLAGAIRAVRDGRGGWDAVADQAEAVDLDFLDAELMAAADQALDGVGRVAKIVQAIKEFSYPTSRTPHPFDLNHMIDIVTTVTRNQWKHVATMRFDLSADLPRISGIEGEMNQVLVNLIVNAAQAIGEKGGSEPGTITLRTRRIDDEVELSISDTGTGIAVENQKKIFEMFFTTKPPGSGTGQGLAIARAIIHRHGGRIKVESEPGAGACFTIRLPVGA